jgi:acylphosphatase
MSRKIAFTVGEWRGRRTEGLGRIPDMPDDVIRRRAVVHGKVQGVFFRDSTREEAARHGVNGWVRNRDDGAVEAVLEGSGQDVEAVLQFLRDGPDRAQVNDIEVHDEEPEGLSSFEVR